MKLKNLALSVLSAAVIVTGLGASLNNTEAAEGDKVILLTGNPNALINGELKKVSEGSVPFIDQNNNTLIPIRFVSEVLSCTVGWDGGAKSITIESANKKSVLTIGKDTFVSGGATAQLSTAPVMKNGRVFVPIKDLGEKILNKKVELSKEGLIGISDAGGLFTGNETEIKALIKKINGVEVVATKEKYMELINSVINKNQIAQNEATLINSRLEESGVAPAAKAEAAEASVAYDSASGGGYSETNTQVSGVDEADIVKTDGEYIYYIANSNVYIVDAKDPSKLIMSEKLNFQQDIIDSKTNMSGSGFNPSEMYIDKNTLTIIGSFYEFQDVVPMPMPKMMVANPFSNKVKVMVYDISNKSNITKTKDFYIDGNYSSSRKINNNLYLISNNYIYDRVGDGPIILPSSFDSADGQKTELDYNRMYYPPEVNTSNLLSITSIDVNNPSENASIQTFLGSSENVYCSNENLYIAVSEYPTENSQQTKIFKFALNNGNVTLAGQGSVEGRVLNQFSMDEYDNYFRIATTNDNWTDSTNNSENNIFILNQGLEVTGKLTGLAKGEQIKSARFMGDKIYLVTFETVDPLFVIDASDPTNPTVLGELKIPGYSTYLHPYDEGHLIGFGFDTKVETYQGNEIVRNTGLKMSLYDVSDINNPKELFSEIIGDEGTYSEILHNHKSLMFDKQRGLIAFPITVVKQREEVIDGATYFGNYQFNGALVYNISLQGFSLKSQISHVQKASDYDYSINRIIYIDNSLFTLSPGKILASDLNSGNELSSLTIGIQ